LGCRPKTRPVKRRGEVGQKVGVETEGGRKGEPTNNLIEKGAVRTGKISELEEKKWNAKKTNSGKPGAQRVMASTTVNWGVQMTAITFEKRVLCQRRSGGAPGVFWQKKANKNNHKRENERNRKVKGGAECPRGPEM